jgi:hypothetical protein
VTASRGKGACLRVASSVSLLSAIAMLVLLVGCTTEMVPVSDVQLPQVDNTPLAEPQQNYQTLRVTIIDGHFDATVYEEQPGATQLLIISVGGPYLFEVDNLVNRRELSTNGSIAIDYDVSAPGRYTMRAYTSTPTGPSPEFASAVLDVRSVVDR